MLKLQRKELKFELDGKIETVKFPTMNQLNDYTKEFNAAGENQNEVLYKFLEKLGLTEGIAGDMQPDHLELILGNLKNEKK